MNAGPNQRIVDLLAGATRSGELLSAANFAPLASAVDSNQVQAATAAALGATIAGWKLGYAPDGAPAAGAMFASTLLASGADVALPAEGDVLVELEIAFRLAQDLPPRPERVYRRAEVWAAIGGVLAGVELLRARFADQPKPDFTLWLADRLGNAGYVAGDAAAPEAEPDLSVARCRLWIDGVLAHDKIGGHPQGDPLLPLLAYANQPGDFLGGLRKGQVITTGSLITPLRCGAPCRIEAEIVGLGRVALQLVR